VDSNVILIIIDRNSLTW